MSDLELNADDLPEEPDFEGDDDAALSSVTAEEAALVTFDFDQPLTSELGLQLQEDAKAKLEAASGSNSIRDLRSGRRDMFSVNWTMIEVRPGWNKRRPTEKARKQLVALAYDIAKNEVKEPLRVYMRDGTLYLSDGHRRLAALRYAVEHLGAKIETVHVLPEPKEVAEDEQLLLSRQLDTDEFKVPKSPLEMAMIFDEKAKLGMFHADIGAERDPKITGQLVGAMIAVARADPAIHEMIDNELISFTFARRVVSAFGEENALEVVKAAIEVALAKGKEVASMKHVPKRFYEEKSAAKKAVADAKKASKAPETELTPANNLDAQLQAVLASDEPEQTDIEEFTGEVAPVTHSENTSEAEEIEADGSGETEVHESQDAEAEAPVVENKHSDALADKQAAIQSNTSASALEKKLAQQAALLETKETVISGIKKVLHPDISKIEQDGDNIVITMEAYDYEHFLRVPLGLKDPK